MIERFDNLEEVPCYYCGATGGTLWGQEAGFRALKCAGCGLVYVSPRPRLKDIDEAIRTGEHMTERGSLSVSGRHRRSRVRSREKIIREMFSDVLSTDGLRWLDIGAGFGELVEAVGRLSVRATVFGLEPNEAKRRDAEKRGVYLLDVGIADLPRGGVDVISLMNVWSHLPDPGDFMDKLRSLLVPGGRILIETGTGADLPNSSSYPNALLLPDHLSFASERHIVGILKRTGFATEQIRRRRVDTFSFAVNRAAKRVLGGPSRFVVPYRSSFRSIYVRAQRESA